MEDKTKIQLTAAEISATWTQYINDTLTVCIVGHFLKKVEDPEVRPILEFSLNQAKSNISYLTELFQKEKFAIPVGFTEEDVKPDAPRLFSDVFVLAYLRNMSILGMAASSVALGMVTRPDIVKFHKNILKAAVGLQDLSRDLMLKQGTYVRPPTLSVPDQVDFVKRQHFLSGLMGDIRPLTSIEISHLFKNVETNTIGKTLIIGFAQVAENEDVKQYLLRGRQIAQKHIDLFSHILTQEDLPAPMLWDTGITNTSNPVFSDKLIMFHISAMIAAGIGNYGAAISASPRRDLGIRYASLLPEISLYAEDGANIMIKHGWLEEPPQAVDRKHLIKDK
ncbi:hypothetical protein JOC77_003382 [Peribacillus deserti]|uniref:DUF3231 domain-containing protein n=1 Tax=Peribacillus deserti TaxID=673318 RepID=A0ABS2QN80_9BACI|nr:DUF3231 family protein [Peribacillus deserti]MBM7693938.1 hypothetical protein [Peribacillus deserti]